MSPQEHSLQQRILQRISKLPSEERQEALQVLGGTLAGGTDYKDLLFADYDQQPPTVDEFLDSDEYMGSMIHQPIGSKRKDTLYPIWRKELNYVLDPSNHIYEWVIRGCIGSGKTTAAILAVLYKLTRTVMLRHPQSYYNLMGGHSIVFAFFNIFKYLAKDVGFNFFRQAIKTTPFFRSVAKFNRQGDVVSLDKGIMFALGAEAAHGLGQNILCAHMDEANFGKGKNRFSEMGQSQRLYTETRDRIDSRFRESFEQTDTGFLCITSSERDKTDFLDSHVERVGNVPGVHISQYALWDAKPGLKSGKWFHVFAGTEVADPRILEKSEVEEYQSTGRVIKVPESPYFRSKFTLDLQSSLRNLAGVGTFGFQKLIQHRASYYSCLKSSTPREHPFNAETVAIGLNSTKAIADYLDREKLLVLINKTTDTWKPRYYPKAKRCIHVDLARNRDGTPSDRAGLSMGCIPGMKRISMVDPDGHEYDVKKLWVWMDFTLRIRSTAGSEIDFEKIRDFVYFLKRSGFLIDFISFDQYQSTDSIQQFTKAGFMAKEVSVDRNRGAYDMLKGLIYANCFDHYDYEPFKSELLDLVDLGKKIDHEDGKSKDVTDSAAGVVVDLLTRARTEHVPLFDEVPSGFYDNEPGIFQASSKKTFSERKVDLPAVTLDDLFEDD